MEVWQSIGQSQAMHPPSADKCNNIIACFLEFKSPLDNFRIILCHLQDIFITKKIGSMEHVNMQCMTLNPFAAIDETPQTPQLSINLYSKGVFHCMDRTHLIGDWTDTADAGGDIRCFRIFSPS